jgi:hypothetical protein
LTRKREPINLKKGFSIAGSRSQSQALEQEETVFPLLTVKPGLKKGCTFSPSISLLHYRSYSYRNFTCYKSFLKIITRQNKIHANGKIIKSAGQKLYFYITGYSYVKDKSCYFINHQLGDSHELK